MRKYLFGLTIATIGAAMLILNLNSSLSAQTRVGHTNKITAIALSPDGRLLASASMDETLRIWDVASASELRTMSGERKENPLGVEVPEGFYSVAFSPDGKLLAAGSNYGIRFFDPATGKKLAEFADEVYKGAVTSLAFSANGKVLAASSGGPETMLLANPGRNSGRLTAATWDVVKKVKLREFPGANSPVVFSPNGSNLAASGDEEWIQVWDAVSGKKTVGSKAPKEYAKIRSISFNKGGTMLAALTDVFTGLEYQVVLVNAYTGKPIKTAMPLTANKVARFAPDQSRFIRDAGKHSLEFVEPVSGKLVSFVDNESRFAELRAASANGRVFAFSNFEEPELNILDTVTRKVSRMVIGFTIEVSSAAFTLDSRTLVAGYNDRVIRWNTDTGKVDKIVLPMAEGKALENYEYSVSEDSKYFLSSGPLAVFDAFTGERIYVDYSGVFDTYRFTPDSKHVVKITKETITIRNANTGTTTSRMLRPMKGEDGEEPHITSSYDNEIVAIGTGPQISFWDAGTGKKIKELPESERDIETLGFSPNGQYFAFGSKSIGESGISVIRYVSQEQVWSSDAYYSYFAFSPDSAVIALIDNDGHLALVSLADPEADPTVSDEPVAKDYLGETVSFAFSPDGKKIAVYGEDGIAVFDARTAKLIRRLK